MTEAEQIELTRAYVALSNAHRADLIAPMLAADACYRSSAVGEHHGREAIVAMMTDFFARLADVHWAVDDYRYRDGAVEFEFEMFARSANLNRSGTERIHYSNGGLITSVEVDTRQT